MDIIKKSKIKYNITNFFGSFGYFFCILQWTWVIVIYYSLIKKLAVFIDPVRPTDIKVVAPAITYAAVDSYWTVIGSIIAVFMLVLTIYIIIKIPGTVTKGTKKIIHKSAANVTPLILRVQKKKDNLKNKVRLAFEVILIIKMGLIILPVILSIVSIFIDESVIDFSIAMYISLFLAGLSLVSFIVQYVLVKFLSVNKTDVY